MTTKPTAGIDYAVLSQLVESVVDPVLRDNLAEEIGAILAQLERSVQSLQEQRNRAMELYQTGQAAIDGGYHPALLVAKQTATEQGEINMVNQLSESIAYMLGLPAPDLFTQATAYALMNGEVGVTPFAPEILQQLLEKQS